MNIFADLHITEPPPRPLTPYQHALAIAKRENQRDPRFQLYDLGVLLRDSLSMLRARAVESIAHRLTDSELRHVEDVFCGEAEVAP